MITPDTTVIHSKPRFSKGGLSLVTITPALAEEWLLRNTGNRKPNNKSFERLVTDLRNGDFVFTADPIKFGTDGTLIDGQCRLRAVIKSGVSITVLVATGVASETRHVIDTGAYMSLRQSLELDGVKHASDVAAALTAVQAWEREEHTANPLAGTTTNRTSLRFLAENPDIETLAHEAAGYSNKIPVLTTKQISALIWAFDKLDRDDRTGFFAKLISGANLEEGSPILRLRNLLADEEISASKRSGRFILAVTIKAWNAYRDGHSVKQLRFVGGGTRPMEFPIPK